MTVVMNSVLSNAAVAAVLATTVWLVAMLPPIRRRPGLRHLLWIIVLMKLVTPPLVELSVLPGWWGPEPAAAPAVYGEMVEFPLVMVQEADIVVRAAPPFWRRIPWVWVAVAVSGLGTAVILLRALWQTWSVGRALRRGESGDKPFRQLARQCARRMGLKAPPGICVVEANIAPLLWVRRAGPLVVIPRRLAGQLSGEQQACVVAHEVAHYLRRDHWTNLVSLFVAAACWWNPVVWWARRELRTAQEACCDALVINRSIASRKTYAETLFHALDFLSAERSLLPSTTSGFGGISSTERRFEMIANPRVNHRLSWWNYPVLLAALASLPCLPIRTHAQESADENGLWTFDIDQDGWMDVYVSEGSFAVEPTGQVIWLEVDDSARQNWSAVTWSLDAPPAPPETDRRRYRVMRSDRGLVVLAFDRASKKLAWSSEIELPRRAGAVAAVRHLLHTGGGIVTVARVAEDRSLTIQELNAETGAVAAECRAVEQPRGDAVEYGPKVQLEWQLKAAGEDSGSRRERPKAADGSEPGDQAAAEGLMNLYGESRVVGELIPGSAGGAWSLRFRPVESTAVENALKAFDSHLGGHLWEARAVDAASGVEFQLPATWTREIAFDRPDGQMSMGLVQKIWRLVNGDAPIESVRVSREGGKPHWVIRGKAD